jgi:hypothetical protein
MPIEKCSTDEWKTHASATALGIVAALRQLVEVRCVGPQDVVRVSGRRLEVRGLPRRHEGEIDELPCSAVVLAPAGVIGPARPA